MQDLTGKITGSTLTAAEWNQLPSEVQNIITTLGISLSSGDLNQLGKAVAGYIANGTFFTDSGTADAYVLTTVGSKQAPPAYTNGMVIKFVAGNTNTGGSATVNVAGLGVKSIKLGGANPAAGTLGTTHENIAVFNSANDRFDITGVARITVFTSSGSYTKPDTLRQAEVMLTAAGGGGGGADANESGAGGGGGGAAIKLFNASAIGSSETVTIGAGGTGGASGGGNNGTAGGSTSFGSLLSATGGSGGNGSNGAGGATSGGTGSGGTLNFIGGFGMRAITSFVGSQGGDSIFGGGGNGSGAYGTAPGAGGSGGSGTLTQSGEDGADGIIIIKEFF